MIKLNHNASCFILFILCYLALLWFLPYFPTQDGPSHLYNLVILRDLVDGGKIWGDFFSYKLKAIPNLGFIITTYPMVFYLSPLVAEKIFVTLYIIFMILSVYYYLKTFNRHFFPWMFFLFPLLFNFSLMKGFYSYCIAIPLFFAGFSLCWKAHNYPHFYKFLILNSIGFTIYYLHLIPFVFFIFSLIIISIVKSEAFKDKIKNLVILAITASPIILNLLIFLNAHKQFSVPDPSYLLKPPRFIGLLVQLFLFSTANFSLLELVPSGLLMFLVILFGYTSLKIYLSGLSQHSGLADSERAVIYLIICLVLIYFVVPFSFFGGSFFNQRFPWVILLVALPLLKKPETVFWNRHGSTVIIGVVGLSFAFNAFILFGQSKKIEAFVRGAQADIAENSFIVSYKTKVPEYGNVDVLLHAASYYGVRQRCVNIGNYEAAFPHFLLRFKEKLPPFPSPYQIAYRPKTIDWSRYSSIDYILAWKIAESDLKALGKYYSIIWQNGPMSIWQRK